MSPSTRSSRSVRGDDDLGGDEHALRAETLDVVEVGELAVGVGGPEVLELGEGLRAEVVAVDEEQDALRAGVLEDPVRERDGRERLAGPGGHLNEGAGLAHPLLALAEGQRVFHAAYRVDLCGTQGAFVEFGHAVTQPGPVAGGLLVLLRLADPAGQGARLVEGEDAAGTGVRVEDGPEAGLAAVAHVAERERGAPGTEALLGVGGMVGVTVGLGFRGGQVGALPLGLDDADEPAVDVEGVVGTAPGGGDLSDGDAVAPAVALDVEVEVRAAVLDVPARRREHGVESLADLHFGEGFAGGLLGVVEEAGTLGDGGRRGGAVGGGGVAAVELCGFGGGLEVGELVPHGLYRAGQFLTLGLSLGQLALDGDPGGLLGLGLGCLVVVAEACLFQLPARPGDVLEEAFVPGGRGAVGAGRHERQLLA
jgi:hypothetical protein